MQTKGELSVDDKNIKKQKKNNQIEQKMLYKKDLLRMLCLPSKK